MRKFNLGPGQYELESIFERNKSGGHKFSIGHNQRSPKYVEPHLRQLVANPSPGAYHHSLIDMQNEMITHKKRKSQQITNKQKLFKMVSITMGG